MGDGRGEGTGQGWGSGAYIQSPARLVPMGLPWEVQVTPGSWPLPHSYTLSWGGRFPIPPPHHTAPTRLRGSPHRPGNLGRKNSSHTGKGQARWASSADNPSPGSQLWSLGLWSRMVPTAEASPGSAGDFSPGACASAAPPSTLQPPTHTPEPPSKLNPYLFGAPTLGPGSSSRWGSGGAGCPWQSG